MKILQCHNYYLYPGGEDMVAASEAALLTSQGHNVIEYRHSNQKLKEMPGINRLKFYLHDIYFSRVVYDEVRALIKKEKPDVAHFHNSFFAIGPAAYEACFDEGVPVVQTLHNYRFLCAAGTFFRNGNVCRDCLTQGRGAGVVHGCWHGSKLATFVMSDLIHSYKKRGILDKISLFISLSEFSRRQFIEAGWEADRITVKPNFLDQDPGDQGLNSQHVLYIGALQSYKGVQTLLNAWPLIKSRVPLKIVGTGPIEDALRKTQLEGVEWLGQRDFNEVIMLIKQAHCVIIPSLCYENFPRVIIEAYACGVPVVGSQLGVLPELIEDGQTGLLFEPGDEKKLADQLNYILQNSAQAKQMGYNARQIFEQRYTAQINYRQIMDIYIGVLNN